MIIHKNKVSGFTFQSLLSILLTAAVFGVLFQNQANLVHEYRNQCSAENTLSWDGNLRFMQTLDAWNDFRQGNILHGIRFWLDTPTWPPLRYLISMILFTAGPSTGAEPYVGFFFGILWIVSAVWIAVRLSGSIPAGLAAGFTAAGLLIRSDEIAAYTLSAMLETQGIFFMLWSLYYLAANYSGQKKCCLNYKLFIFTFGLFFTKYPYGIMLIIGIYIFEIFYYYEDYKEGISHALKNHYRGIRLILIGAAVVLVLVLIITGKVLPEYRLDLRIMKNILWPTALLLFADLMFYTYRFRDQLRGIFSSQTRRVFTLVFLPQSVWLMIHPDRFMSIVDTQQHVQDSSVSFFVSLFSAFFRPTWIFLVLSGLAVLLVFLRTALTGKFRLRNMLSGDDMNVLGALILIQLLIIEFLTGNKQVRHMYHLIPALVILLMITVYRTGYLISDFYIKSGNKNTVMSAALVLPVLISAAVLFAQPALYASGFHKKHPVCFTGTDQSVFAPARWTAESLNPEKKYIIINMFHSPSGKGPWLNLASEMDLAIRKHQYPSGDARNDSGYRYRKWDQFSGFIFLSHSCDESQITDFLKARLEKALPPERVPGPDLWKTEYYPAGDLCRITADF